MNISRNRITLYEDTYEYVGVVGSEKNFEKFKIKMENYIDIINKLINLDIKKLSDQDFYELLKHIYCIGLNKEDIIEILSKKNKKKYFNTYNINTTMTFEGIFEDGYSRDYSYCKQLFQICFNVIVSEKLYKNDSRRLCNSHLNPYTKDEINKMLDNNDIIIMKELVNPIINKDLINFKQESETIFPSLNIDFEDRLISYKLVNSKFMQDNFELFVEMVRRIFTKKRILKDIKIYVEELQDDIDAIFMGKYDCLEITELCKNWYYTSEIKDKHENIRKKLSI